MGTPKMRFKPKLGVLGGGMENKLKNEVKIQNFPYKMSIKSKNLASKFSETVSTYIYI